MPAYIYEHPKTGETIELIQKMKDKHIYIDEEGIEWNRVFFAPNAAIDSDLNADTSSADWMRKTSNKKWTVGDAWDASAELSNKRKQQRGQDPLKKKYFKDYSERRKGIKHVKDNS